MGVKNS